MPGLTLDTILNEVFERASIDKLVQNHITLGIRWVNLTLQDISSRQAWPWLHDRETITTVVDKTAGTVDATLASGTIAGTTTAWAATDVGRYIQFSSSNDWYKITAVASATSATISPVYAPATETGMTYTIRSLRYALSTDVDRVYDIRQYRSATKLIQVDTRDWDRLLPNQNQTGNPRYYSLFEYQTPASSTGQQWAIELQPSPSAAMLLEVRSIRKIVELGAGTAVPSLPAKWHPVLVDGATYLAYLWANSPNAAGMKAIYERGIQLMKDESSPSEDLQLVLQPWDGVGGSSRFAAFPSEFEQPL